VPFFALPWLRDVAGVDLLPPDCADAECLDTIADDEGCDCNTSAGSAGALWMMLSMLAIARQRRSSRRRRSSR
jgi:hypothetical protein